MGGVLTSASAAAPSSTTEAPPGAAPAALEAPPAAPTLGRGRSGGGTAAIEALEAAAAAAAAAAPEGGGASVEAFLGGGSRFAPLLVVLPHQLGRLVPLQLHKQHRVQEVARLRQREVGWGGGERGGRGVKRGEKEIKNRCLPPPNYSRVETKEEAEGIVVNGDP